MASMKEITCKCGCGRKKMVRTADVNRGWGKFFDKSCKAKHQERRTGQCSDYYNRQRDRDRYNDEGAEFSNAHLFSNEE
jgi:hypothetical protein